MEHARQNMAAMTLRAPQGGLVVLKTVWKNGQLGEVQEGEETRPGLPLLDIVDPTRMQVRAKVNQADVPLFRVGQDASIELDAYPGKRFRGRLSTLAPAGVTSALSPRVRTFGVLVTIDGTDPTLLPDLTAAVDVLLERHENVLVVPRDSLATHSDAPAVWLNAGGQATPVPVTVGSTSDTEAVILAGLQEGATVVRKPASSRTP